MAGLYDSFWFFSEEKLESVIEIIEIKIYYTGLKGENS